MSHGDDVMDPLPLSVTGSNLLVKGSTDVHPRTTVGFRADREDSDVAKYWLEGLGEGKARGCELLVVARL